MWNWKWPGSPGSKKDVLNRKFQELFEKTRDDDSKPVRDIDLD